MLAYHLEIQDESIADKVITFLQSFPANTVKLSEEKYDEELESLIDEGFNSPVVGTHEEVFSKLTAKYAI
jgi:hypothetical protein